MPSWLSEKEVNRRSRQAIANLTLNLVIAMFENYNINYVVILLQQKRWEIDQFRRHFGLAISANHLVGGTFLYRKPWSLVASEVIKI